MKPTQLLFFLLTITLLGSLLTACAGGASMATSWPGVTADSDTETVYIANAAHVYAVNLANGGEKWRFPAETDKNINFYAAPTLTEDGQLVAGGYDNLVYSLNPATGEKNWTFKGAEKRYVAAPLAVGELIFAPASDNFLYALTPSGNQSWKFETGHALWGTPVMDGETVYLSSMDHHIYALDAVSGQQQWMSDDLGGALVGDPTLSQDGVLYTGTFGSEMLALDAGDGRVLWRVPATNWVWTGPALDEDTIYYGDLNGTLFAVDAANGAVRWQVQPDDADKRAISDRPLIVDDTLFFVSESGKFFAIDKETGNTRWSRSIDGTLYTAPEVAGEIILVAPVGADAILYAFDLDGNQKWEFAPE